SIFELRMDAFESRFRLGKSDGHLFGQKSHEQNPYRAIQNQRRPRVDDKQAHGQDNAGNDQRRQRKERQIARAAKQIAMGPVSNQSSVKRAQRSRNYTKFESFIFPPLDIV